MADEKNKEFANKVDNIRGKIFKILEEEANVPCTADSENPDMNDSQTSSDFAAALKALMDAHTSQMVTIAVAKVFSLYPEEERTMETLVKEVESQFDLGVSTMKDYLETYLRNSAEISKARQESENSSNDPSMWN